MAILLSYQLLLDPMVAVLHPYHPHWLDPPLGLAGHFGIKKLLKVQLVNLNQMAVSDAFCMNWLLCPLTFLPSWQGEALAPVRQILDSFTLLHIFWPTTN